MGQVYSFNETVIGHLHVLNAISCEDASCSFSSEDGNYYIAIIADGHGSKACFRSERGSKFAVEVALDCLKQFAEATLSAPEVEEQFYKDVFSNPRYRMMTIRHLTDTIIADWHDRVVGDYIENTPTLEEMGSYASQYENGKDTDHIYGTTLMAALQLPKCLLLIHQGDGHCDVFFKDGSVEQPIPWDERCQDTATTSLCDKDAPESVRSCVIDLAEKPVAACFLGCDGVEDAYRDTYEAIGGTHCLMGGVHTFYKDLICQIASKGTEEFQEYLKDFLPDFSTNGKFSRSGSGDDVSVAGIVDLESIRGLIQQFEYDIKLYDLEESLFWKEDELRGKARKHGILKKRAEEASKALEEEKTKGRSLEQALLQTRSKRNELAVQIEAAKMELDEYQKDLENASDQLDGRFTKLSTAVRRFFSEASYTYTQKENEFRNLQEQLLKYDKQIEQLIKEQKMIDNSLTLLEEKYTSAREVFEKYDERYQAIASEKAVIEEKIYIVENAHRRKGIEPEKEAEPTTKEEPAAETAVEEVPAMERESEAEASQNAVPEHVTKPESEEGNIPEVVEPDGQHEEKGQPEKPAGESTEAPELMGETSSAAEELPDGDEGGNGHDDTGASEEA